MPYCERSQNAHIEGSTMIDAGGHYIHNNHSGHVTNIDSGNTTTYNVKDSYNDSSQQHIGNTTTYNVRDSHNDSSQWHIGNKNTYTHWPPEDYANNRAPHQSTPRSWKPRQPGNISGRTRTPSGRAPARLDRYPEVDSDSEGVSEDDQQRYYQGLPQPTVSPLWTAQAPFPATPSQASYDGSFHSFPSPPGGSQTSVPSTPHNPNLVPRTYSPNNPFLPYISPSGSRTGSPAPGQNMMNRGGRARSTQY